jgi:ABC-type microcin C transport system permease subunit YejB
MYLSLLGVLSVVVTPLGYGIFRAIAARKRSILPSQAIVIVVFSVGAVAWAIDIMLMYTEGPSLLSWILD